MPRSAFFSKETIAAAGLEIIRERGAEALTARALSKQLGCSLSPIFTVFEDMDEVMGSIRTAAENAFSARMEGVTDFFPAFKEFGLRLVAFAREDPNVFHMLFLGKEAWPEIVESIAGKCLGSVEQEYGLSKEQAELLLRQMWPVACGIAALCLKRPEAFPEESVSETLSYHFAGIMSIIKSGKRIEDIRPQKR